MNTLLIYLFIGSALSPAFCDMHYRMLYKKHQFYNPNQMTWYSSWVLQTLFWPILAPITMRNYFKEIIKGE